MSTVLSWRTPPSLVGKTCNVDMRDDYDPRGPKECGRPAAVLVGWYYIAGTSIPRAIMSCQDHGEVTVFPDGSYE